MNLTTTIPPSDSPQATSRRITWSPELTTGKFRPISPHDLFETKASPSCLFECELLSFHSYVIRLFQTALGSNKSAVNELLHYPLFKSRISTAFADNKKSIPRINLLCYIAHHHINELEKEDVVNLIKEVGTSTYISSSNPKKVQSLYRDLFSYPRSPAKKEDLECEIGSSLDGCPQSVNSPSRRVRTEATKTASPLQKSFSLSELLEFEAQANETLRPYITAYIEKKNFIN